MKSVVCVAVWIVWAAVAGGQVAITVDGERTSARVLSLAGAHDEPVVGDLIEIDYYWLAIRSEGPWEFRHDPSASNILEVRDPSGEWRAAGVDQSFRTMDGRRRAVRSLSAEEARGLWGINAPEMSGEIGELLARSDLERVCLNVATAAGRSGAMPELPAGVQRLVVDSGNRGSFDDEGPLSRHDDLSGLQRAASLRALVVTCAGATVRAGWLERCGSLRLLSIQAGRIEDADRLAGLGALQALDVQHCRGVGDAAFLRGMPALRRLDAPRSDLSSLAGLDGHGAIEVVSADLSSLSRLPEGHAPHLRRLSALSTAVTEAEGAAFRKANPACNLALAWTDLLRDRLAGATRARLRTGGTCHRSPEEETTLFEAADAAAIAAIVAAIEISDSRSGGQCQCCGSHSIEFMAGDTLIATVGIHHGHGVRWLDGDWPGDGWLTDGSADALSAWLAEHGAPEPQQELARTRARERGNAGLMAEYERILPGNVRGALFESRSEAQAVSALRLGGDDRATAAMCLRLLGCHDRPWDEPMPVDRAILERLFADLPDDAMRGGAVDASSDPQGARGLARWMFGSGGWSRLDVASAEGLIEIAGRAGLAHPDAGSRRATIEGLGECGAEPALRLLRGLVRAASEEGAVGGGSEETGRPRQGRGPQSDATAAALVLLRLGDEAAVADIRAWRERASEADAALIDAALPR